MCRGLRARRFAAGPNARAAAREKGQIALGLASSSFCFRVSPGAPLERFRDLHFWVVKHVRRLALRPAARRVWEQIEAATGPNHPLLLSTAVSGLAQFQSLPEVLVSSRHRLFQRQGAGRDGNPLPWLFLTWEILFSRSKINRLINFFSGSSARSTHLY